MGGCLSYGEEALDSVNLVTYQDWVGGIVCFKCLNALQFSSCVYVPTVF